MKLPVNLSDLQDDALAEQLVTMAQAARRSTTEGDLGAVHGMLHGVRSAAAEASGSRLALLEVAEAFLRALCRSDMGRREVALSALFSQFPEVASLVVGKMLRAEAIPTATIATFSEQARGAIDTLVRQGVFIERDSRLYLAPALRPLAQDLDDPVAFRMWRAVEAARGTVASAQMSLADAAAFVAATLGVSEQQARRHLQQAPLAAQAPGSHCERPRDLRRAGRGSPRAPCAWVPAR